MIRKILFVAVTAAVFALPAAAQEAPEKPVAPGEIFRAMITPESFGGSYIGVQVVDISRENMSKFNLNEVRGVAVEKVLENSPAAKAGLNANDVILRFNGENVSSARKLTRLVNETAPDHTAKITVLRNGAELSFDVTVAQREKPKPFDGSFKMEDLSKLPKIYNFPEFPKDDLPDLKNVPRVRPDAPNGFFWSSGSNRQIGVGVSDLTKQLGEYFGVSEGKGILVNSVRENSPAAKAGLHAGDVIIEIDGKETNSSIDLIRTINEKQDGAVTLTIIRQKQRQSIPVTPEKSEEGSFKLDGDLQKFFKVEPPLKLKAAPEQPVITPFDLEVRTPSKILK